MSRNYSITDVEGWKFEEIKLPDKWQRHLGQLTKGFSMLIEGPSGHGKSEYLMQLMKTLAQCYGKVNFNSTEQGKSDTLKKAIVRNKMHEVKGKIMVCDASQRRFEVWFERLQKPNQGQVIVLDSLDYMDLTEAQYKQLRERFPKKAIIIVCWNQPKAASAKAITYMVDLKVQVKNFKANVASRFGGNEEYIIWDKKPKANLKGTLFEPEGDES